MVQINLLPWREQARQEKQARFGVLLIIGAIIVIIIIACIHVYFKNLIREQNNVNGFLQTTLDETKKELADLQEKKQAQVSLIAQLHYIINLRLKSYQAVHLLKTLAQAVPTNILLDKIIRQDNDVTITGVAQADSEVTTLMKNIGNVKGFQQPVLTGITSQQGPGGDERHFQLKVIIQGS